MAIVLTQASGRSSCGLADRPVPCEPASTATSVTSPAAVLEDPAGMVTSSMTANATREPSGASRLISVPAGRVCPTVSMAVTVAVVDALVASTTGMPSTFSPNA
jgi:hypothetical protein